MTERLINKGTNGEFWVSDTDCTRAKGKLQAVMEKLYKYETAEDEGRMVVLPCKVGDTVYIIDDIDFTYDRESVVTEIDIDSDCIAIMIQDKDSVGSSGYDISDFGETIFLTREEAEKALKKMEGNH